MGLYLNPGNELFQISVNDDIYVDKSGLISYTNSKLGKKDRFLCVSRPRRFGKSTDAEMLAAYYDKSCDSSCLFESLTIANNDSYQIYKNKYDVIFLEIQQLIIDAGGTDKLIDYLSKELIAELKNTYQDCLLPADNNLFKMLSVIYKSKKSNGFIFIIDEWDCIFRKAKNNENAQKEYLEFLTGLFKGRIYVKLAYMTGILPIKKYGTHSALNMFTEFSMADQRQLACYTGFTEKEVKELCKKHGINFLEMKQWYDGYTFIKSAHMYNPKSVIDVIDCNDFKSYWTETETYEALKIYIDINMDGLKDSIIAMFGGMHCPADISAFQNDMVTFKSKDDVLALLVHLGYLGYDGRKKEVFIPNLEIEEQFRTAIKYSGWNEIISIIEKSNSLLEATLREDNKIVAQIIDEVHSDNVSILKYNDENSLSCVLSMAYYSAKKDYIITREFPSGKGYADIVFIPKSGCIKPAIVAELKWNKSANTAINQIKNKHYADSLASYHGDILLVGINYNKNNKKHECMIERIRKPLISYG